MEPTYTVSKEIADLCRTLHPSLYSVSNRTAVHTGVTWRLTCPAANALEPWEREPNSGEEKIELTARLASQGANNA